jgi:hypothetical protein
LKRAARHHARYARRANDRGQCIACDATCVARAAGVAFGRADKRRIERVACCAVADRRVAVIDGRRIVSALGREAEAARGQPDDCDAENYAAQHSLPL